MIYGYILEPELLMKRRNGFIMLFALWTGLIIFSFSLAAAVLAHQYEKQIVMYRYSIEAVYLAESALLMGQLQCESEGESELPEKWEQEFSELAEKSGPGRKIKVVRTLKQTGQGEVTGTLRGIACVGPDGVQRTRALSFNAIYDASCQKWTFTFYDYRI